MTNYTKGRRVEYEIVHLLESVGYTCTRSAGSHGFWDVIAINPCSMRLIQAKVNCKPTKGEMESMMLEQVPNNCSKEIWLRRDGDKSFEIVRV